MNRLSIAAIFIVALVFNSTMSAVGAENVILVCVDGLSPQGIAKAKTPTCDWLQRKGSFSLQTRGVWPTEEMPNWASMISGVGVEQHGIIDSSWSQAKAAVPPSIKGQVGLYPSLLDSLRAKNPRAGMACFHDSPGFKQVLNTKLLNAAKQGKTSRESIQNCTAWLKRKRPQLTLVQLSLVDKALQKHGFLSQEYIDATAECDTLLRDLIRGIRDAGMLEKTVLIVTSSHAASQGETKTASLSHIQIPWLAWGVGIKAGQQISRPMSIKDTAPTIAALLGVPSEKYWEGKSVSTLITAKPIAIQSPGNVNTKVKKLPLKVMNETKF